MNTIYSNLSTPEEYNQLFRHFSRQMNHFERYKRDLSKIELNKMPIENKTILKGVIEITKGVDKIIKELPNLKDIKEIGPLKRELYIVPFERYMRFYEEFEDLNMKY